MGQTQRLNTWVVDVAYPFLMQALDWEKDGKVSIDELVTVMKMIESFVVRRAVCAVPTNRLRHIFARMAVQVQSSDLVASAREYMIDNEWPSDDEFKQKFVSFRLYLRARLGRTRLILESLERSFGHKETPELNDKITIEHVMPQTLTDGWREMLGPGATDVRSRWLDTVGNLTFTGYNPELSNASFDRKKVLLTSSNFALTECILKCDHWNEETMRRRGEELADRAANIWKR